MPGAHRNSDSRKCGATTIVSGQNNVFVNGQLWAVDHDQCTHLSGDLKPIVGATVIINGKSVIVNGDTCYNTDGAGHAPGLDDPSGQSNNVFSYGS